MPNSLTKIKIWVIKYLICRRSWKRPASSSSRTSNWLNCSTRNRKKRRIVKVCSWPKWVTSKRRWSSPQTISISSRVLFQVDRFKVVFFSNYVNIQQLKWSLFSYKNQHFLVNQILFAIWLVVLSVQVLKQLKYYWNNC